MNELLEDWITIIATEFHRNGKEEDKEDNIEFFLNNLKRKKKYRHPKDKNIEVHIDEDEIRQYLSEMERQEALYKKESGKNARIKSGALSVAFKKWGQKNEDEELDVEEEELNEVEEELNEVEEELNEVEEEIDEADGIISQFEKESGKKARNQSGALSAAFNKWMKDYTPETDQKRRKYL